MILTELEQGTDEWKAWRNSRVCASDVAAIMDCCPYQTGYELWERKVGLAPEQKTHRGMALGHAAESEIRTWLNEHTGREYVPVCVECDGQPRFAASLDAWCEAGIAEIKLINADYAAHLGGGGKIHRHHWLQMQWQMYVTGFRSCLYVCRHGSQTTVRNVPWDEGIQDVMGRQALEFLVCIDHQIPWNRTDADIHNLEVAESLEHEYLCALEILDEQKQIVEALKHKLLSSMRHKRERGRCLQLITVERKGTVDYTAMLNALAERYSISDEDLDPELWRKPSSEYVKISELRNT